MKTIEEKMIADGHDPRALRNTGASGVTAFSGITASAGGSSASLAASILSHNKSSLAPSPLSNAPLSNAPLSNAPQVVPDDDPRFSKYFDMIKVT
jgi:hypothetical protein